MSVLNPEVEQIEIRSGGMVDHREGLLSHRPDMVISADMSPSEETRGIMYPRSSSLAPANGIHPGTPVSSPAVRKRSRSWCLTI
jgi:hypothetical protein